MGRQRNIWLPKEFQSDFNKNYALIAIWAMKAERFSPADFALASSLANTLLGSEIFTRSISSESKAGSISAIAQMHPLYPPFF